MSRGRIVIAFVIAPLVTPVVLELSARLAGSSTFPLLIGVFAYLATIVFGVPAFFIYRALNWTNVFLFVLGGSIIGFIVTLFVFESYTVEYFLQFLHERIWCMVAGGLSAFVFRLILFGLTFNGTRVSAHGET